MVEETLKSENVNIEINKTIDDGFVNDENDLDTLNILQPQIDNDKFLIYNHDAFAMLKSKNNMKLLSEDNSLNYLGYLSFHKDKYQIDLKLKSKYSCNDHLLNYMLSKIYGYDADILSNYNLGLNDLIFINAFSNAIKKGIFRKYIEIECM